MLLTSIACSASEAAGPGNDTRPDCVPSFCEHSSQAAIMFTWGDALRNSIDRQTPFIRHKATELQKRAAAQNAKTYYARLGAGQKSELKKKNIRYLAVPTVRSKQTLSKAKVVLMIWEMARESLVSEYVYELDTAPPVGEVIIDKMHTEYIGKGPETL